MIQPTRLFVLVFGLPVVGATMGAPVFGQGGTVVGAVRASQDTRPVPDARVYVLGTTLSSVSDADGRYRIAGVPPGERSLLVSAPGYVVRTLSVAVPAGDSGTLDVALTRSAGRANPRVILPTGEHEAIVLGVDLTQVVVAALADAAPAATFSEVLAARSAGIEAIASSGTAGTGSQITMRGVANPYLSVAPLVYVDGVRVEANPSALTVDVGGQAPSRLDDFDPSSLEGVEVLRGPAAAALYGAEATNGVLLLTTRRGAPGPIRFRAFTAQGFASEASRFPDNVTAVTATGVPCPLDAEEAGSCVVQRILRSNPLESGPASPIAPGAVAAYGLEASGSVHTVRFAVGGDERTNAGIYHLPDVEANRLLAAYGPGALRDEVLDPNHLRQTTGYATATLTPSARLEVGAAARFVSSSLRLPLNDYATGLLANALLGAPDSTPGGRWWQTLPGEVFQLGSSQGIDRVMGSVHASWRPTAFLELRGLVGAESVRQHDEQLQRSGEGPSQGGLRPGFVADNWARTRHTTANVSGAAAERFGAKVTGRTTVGVEYWRASWDTLLQQGSGLLPGQTRFVDAQNQNVHRSLGYVSGEGYLLEQELVYANRLFVGGALRLDHARGLASSPATVVDPAAWASWLVPLHGAGALEFVRLRTAIGSVARRFPYPAPANSISGAPGRVPDPERTAESELGADVELFDGRLGIGATAYGKRTAGFATFILTPPSSGVSYRLIKGGDVWNQGVEFDVRAEPLRSERATLDVHLTAWGNRNRAGHHTAFLLPVGFQQWVFGGYPLGTYYTALVTFNDINRDGRLTRSEITVGDPVPSGSPLPTQGASASVTVAWRHWLRLSTTLEYRGGGSQQNLTAASRCQQIVCSERSVPGTPLADQARALADGLGLEGRPVDAGFVKLREVALTMTAP